MKPVPIILAGAAIALSAACGSSKIPNFFVLPSPATGEAGTGVIIGLESLTLPSYARQDKIVSLSADNIVLMDDDNRWAEPLEPAIAARLSRELTRCTGAPVALRPYMQGVRPEMKISISFDKFLRSENGSAEIGGQYFVSAGRLKETISVRRFEFSVPAKDKGYPAFADAVSEAVTRLGEDVSRNLAGSQSAEADLKSDC